MQVLHSHQLVVDLLEPSPSPSYTTTRKYSNNLFHGRTFMTFILSLNSRDTIQACTLFIHINLIHIWITLQYYDSNFFFGVEHILLLISKTLLCHLGSRISHLSVFCILNLSSENSLAIPVADIFLPPSHLPLIHQVDVCL